MVKYILYQYFLKATLVALLALVLYGVFPGTGLAAILISFVGLRLVYLATNALRKHITTEQWEARAGALARTHERSTPEEHVEDALRLKFEPNVSAREPAQTQINNVIRSYVPPRPKLELGAEALGVVAFAIFLPIVIALYTRDFFSLRTPQGWAGAMVAVLCLAAYAWPHCWLKLPRFANIRMLWWALPFAPTLFLLKNAVETRHPYLNPFDSNHPRLAAERVLALKNNVVAAHHVDWVLRYARQLDQQGKWQQSVPFYREALRLDANNRENRVRLAALEARLSGGPAGSAAKSAAISSAPYWTDDKPIIRSPRGQIDSDLENVEVCTVVIVPVGEVSDDLLDAVGHVIRTELELPVCVSTNAITLPPYTRVRGLVTGRQWDATSLIQALLNTGSYFPKSPIKYVLITPVDIYSEGASYVFSGSYEWGAIVSSARFGESKGDDLLLCQRTAKQTLCALIKSFKVPMSTDRNCVTSYTRSLEEFDAKGTRPNALTLAQFRQSVDGLNRGWQNFKAAQQSAR